MSLLKPSPGEICDRLSIIALKIADGNTAQHLVDERLALLERLDGWVDPSDWMAYWIAEDQLAAVNAFIWHKEDEVRRMGMKAPIGNATEAILEAAAWRHVAELAIEIRKLADRRHYLIAEIDGLFGEDRAGKEKSWMMGRGTEARENGPSYRMQCPSCGGPVRYYDEESVQCQARGCRRKTDIYEATKAYEHHQTPGGA